MKNIAIREHHLYNKTFTRGKRFTGKYIAVYVLKDFSAERLKKENPKKEYVNRLGLSVSKKLGGAVQRNRSKRVMRSAYDEVRDSLKKGHLIVISPRIAILSVKSTAVAEELKIGFTELGLLKSQAGSQK